MSNALDFLAALGLDDGRKWGEAAASFQWEDARAVLTGSRPYHFLTRGRGGSKTTDLAGMVLAAMATQLPTAARCYMLAADRDQGRLGLDALSGFVHRTPGLRAAFAVDSYRVTYRPTGTTVEVLAADAPGSWGLRPEFVVVDELAQWASAPSPRQLWEAVSSAAAKLKGCRLVVLTTSGDPSHWSRKVLDHAKADRLWRVHEVQGPAPWLDRERVEEQRRRLPESSFRRLFLNEWTAAEDRLAFPEDIAACVTLGGPQEPDPNRSHVIGVDLGLTHDRTDATVAHAEYDPSRVVLDRMEVWEGTRKRPVTLATVEDWLVQASRTYRARLIIDPWQAVGLAQRLRARGLTVQEFTFSAQSVGRLASTLYRLIKDHALAIPDDQGLIEELMNVRLRETSPGVLRMDHDPDKHDDRAVALGLAALSLIEARHEVAAFGAGLSAANQPLLRATSRRFETDWAGGAWA
jgi:hypothetical protein